MFGGIGFYLFLFNGNMCFGVYKDYLILRAGTDVAESLPSEEYVKPFDINGQLMKGWVMVVSEGFKSDRNVRRFVQFAEKFDFPLAYNAETDQQSWQKMSAFFEEIFAE